MGAAEHLPPLEGHAPPPPPVQDPQLSPERGGPRLPPLTPARRLGAPAHRPGARTPPSCCGYVGAGEGRRGGWTGSQLGRKTGGSWIRFSKEGQGSHRGGGGGGGRADANGRRGGELLRTRPERVPVCRAAPSGSVNRHRACRPPRPPHLPPAFSRSIMEHPEPLHGDRMMTTRCVVSLWRHPSSGEG